jgi:hypothetical protein
MGTRRRLAGALISTIAALTLLSLAAPAAAGSLDACAQRVIRDWYSGGRVDDVYPLGCYRAALRALPSDVLQYSNADQDIRRALAFARKGRGDPGDGPGAAATPEPNTTPPTRPAQAPASDSVANDVATATPDAPATRVGPAAGPSMPYPIIALASLAALLLAAAAAALITSRRSRPGAPLDR